LRGPAGDAMLSWRGTKHSCLIDLLSLMAAILHNHLSSAAVDDHELSARASRFLILFQSGCGQKDQSSLLELNGNKINVNGEDTIFISTTESLG
jgi:hypothetical protein